jgi:hypothetical protein
MSTATDFASSQAAVATARAVLSMLSPAARLRALAQLVTETASEIATPVPSTATRVVLAHDADLTDRQRSIFEWIVSYIDRNGYPPTLREIGLAFGIRSTNGVNDHLHALERKGVIERSVSEAGTNVHRNIRIVRQVQP